MIVIHLPAKWDWTLRDRGFVVRMQHRNNEYEVFQGSERIGTVKEGVLYVEYPNAIAKAQRVLSVLEGAG